MKWHITPEAALANWRICFDEGLLTAARAWWLIYWELTTR